MKPYIVCHMMASVDGRIDCAMTEQIESGDEYYEALGRTRVSLVVDGAGDDAAALCGCRNLLSQKNLHR